jgi:transposase, IS5 family
MKFFKAQYSFDFEPAIWDREPELLIMDQVLDQNISIIMLAAPCFPKASAETNARIGRDGMTLEQVVRAAIYQRHKRLTYRELSDHSGDSKKCRIFLKMDRQRFFSHQALQENIAKIDSNTLAKIHLAITEYAIKLGVDNGKKLRIDSTTIKTNIHFPTNAALLWDCIRVADRLLNQCRQLYPEFKPRSFDKFGKKLLFKIVNTKGKEKRRPLFKKMIQANRRCERLVEQAIERLSTRSFQDARKEKERLDLFQQFTALLPKLHQVTDMSHRREILDEQVPVNDKMFSIFEDHTDCIKKGGREVIFGHKINFSSGKSNLIFDCIQQRGNPADTSYFPKTLDNLKTNFNITPRDVATDGGYASGDNFDTAKAKSIVNIVFNKVKGSMQNRATSKKMETQLKKWRSGMEAVISNFKRGLNAAICPWKGWEAFKCFVLWSLITFNLRVIAKFISTQLA